MDVMEKLVELLREVQYLGGLEEKIADHLIANGVTVQGNCKACAEATQNCIVKLQEQIAELRSVQGDKDNNVLNKWISVKDRLPEIVSTHKRYRSTIKKSIRVLCVCVQKSGKTMVKEGLNCLHTLHPCGM